MLLGVIQGIVAVGAGLFLVLDRDNADLQEQTKMSDTQLLGSGIGLIAAGAILLILALMLGRGSNPVRWLFAIVTVVNVSFGVWGIFGLHGEQQLSAAFTVVFGLVVLWLLFGAERTDDFFTT